MTRSPLPFRQVHLDFHNSPDIPGIGERFDRKRWQETLRRVEVNSITLFSKCHHGWSYHDTKVGARHPGLGFDLLKAQFEATKEIGIAAPVYLSAGLDSRAAALHPEWIELNDEGRPVRRLPLRPGFDKLCFHSPYLDFLCEQIEEAAALFPGCDGIFLDIVNQGPGCSPGAMAYMAREGLDPLNEGHRRQAAQAAVRRYHERTTAAARRLRADMPVFHNAGHIARGDRALFGFQSHFELESLPTGGWGYDHFPESAAYVSGLGKPFLGMTGKFHTTWGEMGGFKHPNALRYECLAMLACGAACSIGDQLPPTGEFEETTYATIGAAYREVKAQEPWCAGAVPAPRIAILSAAAEAASHARENAADTGAVRVLLEEHLPFALLDREMELAPYALVIFPDTIRFDAALEKKVQAYLAGGGRVLLTGESGLRPDGDYAVDTGAAWEGPSPFEPDYVLPRPDVRPGHVADPFVVYPRSQRLKAAGGESLGEVRDPWFNRTYAHFSGHQHAPARPEPSGYDCGVRNGNVAVLAHPVFTAYRTIGHLACRDYVARVIRLLLGAEEPVRTNLPSAARITVTRQEAEKRWIVHLLYAPIILRGGQIKLDGGTQQSVGRGVEVIEELPPLRGTEVSLREPGPGLGSVKRVTREPQGTPLPFTRDGGRIAFRIDEFTCHQMVVLHET